MNAIYINNSRARKVSNYFSSHTVSHYPHYVLKQSFISSNILNHTSIIYFVKTHINRSINQLFNHSIDRSIQTVIVYYYLQLSPRPHLSFQYWWSWKTRWRSPVGRPVAWMEKWRDHWKQTENQTRNVCGQISKRLENLCQMGKNWLLEYISQAHYSLYKARNVSIACWILWQYDLWKNDWKGLM